MPHFYPVVFAAGRSVAGDSLGFHAYSLRIDNLTNQWLLEETSLAWIPPYSLGMCLRLYGTGVAIILNQAPVGQLQLPAVSGEQTIGVYSDQLRTEVAGTGVRQFTLVQAVSDLTMGPEPALPPVGVDRLWADTSGLIHHLHSNGVDTILVDPLQTGVVTSGMILDGTIAAADLAAGAAAGNVGALAGVLTGTLPNPGMAAGAAAGNVGALGGDLTGTLPNPLVVPTTVSQFVGGDTLIPGGTPTYNLNMIGGVGAKPGLYLVIGQIQLLNNTATGFSPDVFLTLNGSGGLGVGVAPWLPPSGQATAHVMMVLRFNSAVTLGLGVYGGFSLTVKQFTPNATQPATYITAIRLGN